MPDPQGPIGATLAGKYEIRRMIGRGGMGAVYEGAHIEIGKRVAIKLLDPEHSKAEEISARFRREGRAASRVESDHVVQVFDVGQDPEFGLYMVMEYLVGEDLATRLERDKKLEVNAAVEVALQAARGLSKAHAAGVIHRDLKPANIFLAERDNGTTTCKLVDFGISKLVVDEANAKGAITRWGSAVGTPQYMSPEQAQGFAIDARTDIWALGAVLYEMLSGRQAYELKENYEQTIFAIVLQKPPSLAEIAPWVPQALIDVVAKALEHDIEKRIPDCASFARLLAHCAPHASADTSGRITQVNAPLALTRRASGSHEAVRGPDSRPTDSGVPSDPIIVVPPGSRRSNPRDELRAVGADTAPHTILGLGDMTATAPTDRPPSGAGAPPATMTGVAVKTGGHAAIPSTPSDPPYFDDEPLSRKPKRSLRAFAILTVLLIGAGIGGAVMLRRPLHGNTPTSGGEPTTPAPAKPSTDPSETQQPASSNTNPANAIKPSIKPLVPPGGSAKPLKGAKPTASTAPSTSAQPPVASTKPPVVNPPSGDQFGGAGVSNSY